MYDLSRTVNLSDLFSPFKLSVTHSAATGVLYVRLEEEEDGRLNLWGYRPDAVDNSAADPEDHEANAEPSQGEEGREDDRFLQPLQLDWSSGASTPMSSGSEMDMISAVDMEQTGLPSRPSSG